MNIFPYLLSFALALPACAAPVGTARDDDAAYTAGTRAMNESRWQDAVMSFDHVVAKKGKKSDAALYWKAYSLVKVGKPQLASATCTELNARYRASPWNRDCAVLTMELRLPADHPAVYAKSDAVSTAHSAKSGTAKSRTSDADAELKLLALNSLANRDPAQAMPILNDVLKGGQSQAMKQYAFFVLTQSHSAEAQAMMKDLIQGKEGTALQRQAIQASSMYYGKRNNDTLAEVYRTSSDREVREAVLSAFFISGDDVRMVEMARSEKDTAIKLSIVSQLSLMQGKAAQDYMLELLK